MGDERAVALDLVVQRAELVAVALDREAGDDPDHEAQEVDDRADVVEDGAQPLRAEVGDDEPGLLRGLARASSGLAVTRAATVP